MCLLAKLRKRKMLAAKKLTAQKAKAQEPNTYLSKIYIHVHVMSYKLTTQKAKLHKYLLYTGKVFFPILFSLSGLRVYSKLDELNYT